MPRRASHPAELRSSSRATNPRSGRSEIPDRECGQPRRLQQEECISGSGDDPDAEQQQSGCSQDGHAPGFVRQARHWGCDFDLDVNPGQQAVPMARRQSAALG